MQARVFIHKWQTGSPAHALNERAGAQAHFIDLCRVLGMPEPGDPERYCFERGLTKTGSLTWPVEDGFLGSRDCTRSGIPGGGLPTW